MFGIFMLMTIFGQLVQQIMPLFVTQRSLYEVRERPSKTYSWKAFMMSNIIVELPWSLLCAVLIFLTWYYPIGLYENAKPTDAVHERGALMFLYILAFLLFTSTFAHMTIAGIADAETGGNIANLAFSLTLVFCGVLVGPKALPGFWIFMYRVSPFTYLIDGMLSTAVAHTSVTCAKNEYLNFNPLDGQTCAEYMQPYISTLGGYLLEPDAQANCSYCQISNTDTFLASISAHPQYMWRNFGLLWPYIIFNIFAAVFLYWLVRVPKKKGNSKKELASPGASKDGSVYEAPAQVPPHDSSPVATQPTVQEKQVQREPDPAPVVGPATTTYDEKQYTTYPEGTPTQRQLDIAPTTATYPESQHATYPAHNQTQAHPEVAPTTTTTTTTHPEPQHTQPQTQTESQAQPQSYDFDFSPAAVLYPEKNHSHSHARSQDPVSSDATSTASHAGPPMTTFHDVVTVTPTATHDLNPVDRIDEEKRD